MKKKTFFLLEILVGLVLIEVIAIPLLTRPIQAYRQEIESLEKGDQERLADLTFMEIKEKILKNEISFDKLPKPGETKEFFLSPKSIEIPGFTNKEIERKITIKCDKDGEKDGTDQGLYRILKVNVQFSPFSKKRFFSYRIIVRKIPSNPD